MAGPVDSRRLPVALLVLVVWVLATLFSMKWADDGTKKALVDTLTHGVSWNLVIAIAVLALASFIFRWRDLGFVMPDIGKSIRLAWFPLLYLVLFLGIALVLGLPPLGIVLFVAVNTILVGISEEWMFRGVLFRGLRSQLSMWPAIVLTCLLFGSVHVLNVFVTGDLGGAALQATTAAMSGLVFMALLIRTGSIWVPIVYHALWDFGTFMISAGADRSAADPLDSGGIMYLVPLALVLPNFLYALYLLRNVRNDKPTRTRLRRQAPHRRHDGVRSVADPAPFSPAASQSFDRTAEANPSAGDEAHVSCMLCSWPPGPVFGCRCTEVIGLGIRG